MAEGKDQRCVCGELLHANHACHTYNLQERVNVLESRLKIAIKALKYCQIEPELLYPENNRQNIVAYNALNEIGDGE